MDNPSSPSKNNEAKKTPKLPTKGIALMNEDLLQNVLYRLPAVSFASAACVSKSWNQLCNRILSRPKLASALSMNPSKQVALQEVIDKVLCEPLRPDFAIANVDRGFDLAETLQILVEKLGSQTPIVLSRVSGIIGRDATTGEFREVTCDEDEENEPVNSCILLTIGFVPGLKVDAIPLLRPRKAPQAAMIDNFVVDIRNYTTSISGCATPVGIIMFGDARIDQKVIIEKLDYAMPAETVIVGQERGHFVFRNGSGSINVCRSTNYNVGAVALVFARDRNKPHGIGNIQFHVALSNGVSPIGPSYRAVSVRSNSSSNGTWLTARREGQQVTLDGQTILDDINNALENRIGRPELYVGVVRRRKCSIGLEKPRSLTSLAFHGVVGGDEEYLYADGVGIKTGDYLQFYQSDPNIALSSIGNVTESLRSLKLEWSSKNCIHVDSGGSNVAKNEVVGGFIFACCGRSASFYGHVNVESSPFLENFPGVPLAGVFCCGEILRGSSTLTGQEGHHESSTPCCLHIYSTVYLMMSYNSAPQ
ncbi:hypothetical protein HS088_TW18G00920 [Tripterygium wilfordii]|uniref:F-box/LRR-repeat protein n=1 Tax=Tripterygium wilfordii TaxID=458696 RepID=A0A7J7CDL3_TRIWF|nr:F-box/LRR-repeat protein At5g63520-like [Tripterygium wilfordii]KAF5732229.1 hypothetical protein HS088_TW18G00920 [Tripterygium wilfordii]